MTATVPVVLISLVVNACLLFLFAVFAAEAARQLLGVDAVPNALQFLLSGGAAHHGAGRLVTTVFSVGVATGTQAIVVYVLVAGREGWDAVSVSLFIVELGAAIFWTAILSRGRGRSS